MRRTFPLVLLAMLSLGAGPAAAQHFPAKTVKIVIPYPAGGSTDAVQIAVATLNTTSGMVKAGRAKALAIGGAHRSSLFPDVATLAEQGYKYAVAEVWFGLFAPGGTSAELINRINRDTIAVIKQPDFQDKYFAPNGLNIVANTPSEFAAAIRNEVALTAEMVKAADIKPE